MAKRKLTEEQRKAASERMKKMHAERRAKKEDAARIAKVENFVDVYDSVVEETRAKTRTLDTPRTLDRETEFTESAVRVESAPGGKPVSWKPASVLTVTDKDPNYSYRWCRKDIIDKKMAEGWQVINKSTGDKIDAPVHTFMDGSQDDSTVQKRELILCRMPKEVAKARNDYYSAMVNDPDELRKQFAQNIGTEKGSYTYGRVESGVEKAR